MSIAKRLLSLARIVRRRTSRVPADVRNAEALRARLRDEPPLTVVAEIFEGQTLGLGVRLDTSICLPENLP
ncbi:MAG: hypothetical protein U0990_09350 [Candidatus Nanopelagicales bacterium]|nr:hypothetical protein [Candidatus Nanopelagicales bacterium]